MTIDTITTAKKVIDLQIKALKKLKGSLDVSFNNAVNTIAKCKSKIIYKCIRMGTWEIFWD